jgi:hypothetical protein
MDPLSKNAPERVSGRSPPEDDLAGTTRAGLGTDRSIKPAGRRWRRRLIGLLVTFIVFFCLYLFRVPILQGIGGYLVVDEAAAGDYVALLGRCDSCYDRAAELCQSGSATGILVLEHHPKRLERMGFLPSFTTLTQRELAARAVPPGVITVIPGETRNDWDRARCLRAWLQAKPGAHVVILGGRFDGRRLRYILDTVLGTDYAARVRLLALPQHPYDERDWWRNRLGIAHVFDCYVRLAYVRLWGEDRLEWREWDPEDYKKRLH